MPLFDHFHGPLAFRPWQSFHFQWGACIAAHLNRTLPRRFVADSPMRLGSSVEADVVEYEPRNGSPTANDFAPVGQSGGVAVAAEPVLYAPPAADHIMPAEFPPELLVEVRDVTDHYRVVAVVELVSPGNKKEANEREQFAAKCLSYLGRGIGLIVLDIVTERRWNLHNELVRIAEYDPEFGMADASFIYAAAYRPVRRHNENVIDAWLRPLTLGEPLPELPLALKGYGCVRLDLEATYAEACERNRIP